LLAVTKRMARRMKKMATSRREETTYCRLLTLCREIISELFFVIFSPLSTFLVLPFVLTIISSVNPLLLTRQCHTIGDILGWLLCMGLRGHMFLVRGCLSKAGRGWKKGESNLPAGICLSCIALQIASYAIITPQIGS
jgi:hypothetical protein